MFSLIGSLPAARLLVDPDSGLEVTEADVPTPESSSTGTSHPFWGNFRVGGYSSEMPIPSIDFVASNNRSNANQATEC
jgi:hypothetical protein